MKIHSSTDDVFLLVAGFNHVDNIAKYLPNSDTTPCITMFDRHGVLSRIGAPTFPLSNSPESLLTQFRLARQHKNSKN